METREAIHERKWLNSENHKAKLTDVYARSLDSLRKGGNGNSSN